MSQTLATVHLADVLARANTHRGKVEAEVEAEAKRRFAMEHHALLAASSELSESDQDAVRALINDLQSPAARPKSRSRAPTIAFSGAPGRSKRPRRAFRHGLLGSLLERNPRAYGWYMDRMRELELAVKRERTAARGLVESPVPWFKPALWNFIAAELSKRMAISDKDAFEADLCDYCARVARHLPVEGDLATRIAELHGDGFTHEFLVRIWETCPEEAKAAGLPEPAPANPQQSTVATPPGLDAEAIGILRYLARRSPELSTYDDIQGGACITRKTLANRSRLLVKLGYICRPNGPKKGTLITAAGKAAFEKCDARPGPAH